MKIHKIELVNFGSYEGRNTFEFDVLDLKKRVVIIGGKNGAGKTTLFTAIQVCLYGHYAFGLKSDGKIYLDEISNLINNKSRLDETQTSSIEIEFTEQQARESYTYRVCRQWVWDENQIEELWKVQKNGVSLDPEQLADFQNYLLHLIPPDMLKLYFFDGEKIADYFLDEHHGNVRDALMILSGNDTFDILHDVVKRILNSDKSKNQISAQDYIRKKELVQGLAAKINAIKAEVSGLSKQLDENEASAERAKSEYAMRGGITLDDWKTLTEQMKKVEDDRERLNAERKSAATDILPFVIMKDLVEQVKPQMKRERDYLAFTIINQSLQDDTFMKMLADELSNLGVDRPTKSSHDLSESIRHHFGRQEWNGFEPIFGLSEDEEMQAYSVLSRIEINTETMLSYSKKILKSLAKSKKLRTQLQKSSIDNLEDHLRKTSELKEDHLRLKLNKEQLELELEKLSQDLDTCTKDLQNAQKTFEEDLKQQSVQSVSGRILLLLEQLQDQLYHKLILQVQLDVNKKLQQLMRKEQFIDNIYIDDDFNIHLLRNQKISKSSLLSQLEKRGLKGIKQNYGTQAIAQLLTSLDASEQNAIDSITASKKVSFLLPIEIAKDRLSNGEKQIFVMSLYWALMQQSNHDLPFIIDTPFARIDTEHRENITKHFFTQLDGQLFVLSTNEELNKKHLTAMEDKVSDVFLLEYGLDKRTWIHRNQYFEG